MSDTTWTRQNVVNKNVSLQTGEEFSMEFLKDHHPPPPPTHNDVHTFGDLYYHNQPPGFHDLRRIESECPSSDAYDFGRDPRTSTHVENGGYTPQFNNACYNNNLGGGEKEVITRKAFGEINSNQGCLVTGKSAPSVFLPERVHSTNNYTGGGGGGGDFNRFGKVKFLCSFGGKIMPRSSDEKLKYVGGETHIISIRKNLSWEELKKKTSAICQQLHSIKYQLPGDELDSLISVSSDEDLQNMMEEYNGLERPEGSQRPRLFLIPIAQPENKAKIAGDTSYHVNHLDQMLRLDTTAMHSNQLFNGVQYNMSAAYPSPPISPSPFMHKDCSQFLGDNSSSESNNSFTLAQPEPSVNFQTYKHEAENSYQSGFNKKHETPIISHGNNNGRGFYCEKPCITEEPKVSFSGSTNSNDSFLGIPHSYSDSTLEVNGGHSSYFSQERQSPSSPLNFTKKQTEEKDLSSRRTHSNILDFRGGPGLSGEDKTIRRDTSDVCNHFDEIFLNQDGNSGKVLGTGVIPANMEFKNLPTYGNQTSVVSVDDPWKQIKQDNDRLMAGTSSGNLISLDEGIAPDTPNQEGRLMQKPSDLIQEPVNQTVRARNLEVSGVLLNKRAESDVDFLFNISSESGKREIVHETGRLELEPTQNNRVNRQSGSGHVRIQSMDLNQPVPETTNGTYNLKIPPVQRQDSLVTTPHAKLDSSDDTLFHSEEAEANVNEKENDSNDAFIVEMEASVYGLQMIKNADLEDLTELGSGTYGTVFHGKWRGTDVAIKRIRKSCFAGRSSESERLTKDFWREAQILSNLHHPNVVAFYGIVPDGAGGTLATVTEFMVNGSLRHALVKRDRLLDARKKIIIAMDAAFGMEYLHLKNIVHFDLKCENLLVNLRDPQRPICKVGDLGLSRIKRNTLVSGGVRGTLPWMAPELLNGSSTRVSEKVDVFSYGICLWEILTGEEPYADMHCGAIIGGIVKNTLRPPIPKTCSPEWKKLMEQCWDIDPDARPPFTEITSRLRSMSMELVTKSKKRENKP
ncbi:Kinase superfamily with octicosapeptide/Phox/Bem1p domain-containing protein [Hirschfeldia incana]|nr:Kinase superfamily with octicosapeptide/Phox/Bem1p domain-containing protein [Hirschfeldia incana]